MDISKVLKEKITLLTKNIVPGKLSFKNEGKIKSLLASKQTKRDWSPLDLRYENCLKEFFDLKQTTTCKYKYQCKGKYIDKYTII